MKRLVWKTIIQASLLASTVIALGNAKSELKDRDSNRCKHIHEPVDDYNADTFPAMQNAVSTKASETGYTPLAAEPEATKTYSKYTKYHHSIQNATKSGTWSTEFDLEPEAAYTKIRSGTKESSHETTSEHSARSSVIRATDASSATIKSDSTFTSDGFVVVSSTTAETSRQSATTSTTSTLIPLSTFALCPYYNGLCSGTGTKLSTLFYIRCGRSLVADATTRYNCVPQPSLKYEGSCNQACFNDPICKAWSGSYLVLGVGFPNGTYDCCHIYEELTLKPDVPAPVDVPFVPFSGSSYGIRGLCPLGATNMCPYYDSQCVEGIQVHCGHSLNIDTNSNPQPSDLTNDNTQFSCHQSCVEDPTCTAWSGFDDFLDLESGGGIEFNCYHYNDTFVLNPNIPPGNSTGGYGVKGC